MPNNALIVIDMFNPYDHEDAEPLVESVREALPQIVELRDRALDSDDTLLLYVNDNYERWEDIREDLVRAAMDGRHPELVEPLIPPDRVPFLMKGKHSIYYQTPVDHLLQVREIERVVLCGQVTEQCVLYSALDAYMRGYEVHVPRDAVAHIDARWADSALGMMEKNMHADLGCVRDGDFTGFR